MSTERHGPALVVLAAGRARRYGGVKPLAPVGPAGEPVLDLLAGDALTAGFGTLVVVVGPSTGAALRYHVRRTWPAAVDVRFAEQAAPIGTVDAVLAGLGHLEPGSAFGVANADDLYGVDGLSLLAAHLAGPSPTNALVAYRLRHAVVGGAPVTRGICEVAADGTLASVTERRMVTPIGDGRFVAKDGGAPSELDGGSPVSMNLWGFDTAMPGVLAGAMASARHASEDAEVLLPEAVDAVLRRPHGGAGAGGPSAFRVLATEGRCIGVTHPDDLALVQADLASQVGRGDRPASPWPPAAATAAPGQG
ncbi:MAG: NTP transferase domain-containing protein [Acidimicrobiales bacterium]